MEITGSHATNILNPVIESCIREYVGIDFFLGTATENSGHVWEC